MTFVNVLLALADSAMRREVVEVVCELIEAIPVT